MSTRVVNRRLYPFDIYIGRGSRWGNPFSHKDGTTALYVVKTRAEAIERYEVWLKSNAELLAALPELRGKVLGCYCKPLACHGDVLARFADTPFTIFRPGDRLAWGAGRSGTLQKVEDDVLVILDDGWSAQVVEPRREHREPFELRARFGELAGLHLGTPKSAQASLF